MSRFNIADNTKLQSRDGSLSKGALIRNGFVEVARNGERWCWQRPALSTSKAAPLTGNGLGFYIVGPGTGTFGTSSTDTIWGMYSAGTATSAVIPYPGVANPFSLNAEQDGPSFGLTGTVGSLSPSLFNGVSVQALFSITGGSPRTEITLQGSRAQNFLSQLSIGTSVLSFSSASWIADASNTGWTWLGTALMTSTGAYTGYYTY